MMPTETNRIREYTATGKTQDGASFLVTVLRLNRYVAVVEVYDPQIVLRVSQLLPEFRIALDEVSIYVGRATVASIINSGQSLVCEFKLAEGGLAAGITATAKAGGITTANFQVFLQEWQKVYRVLPEFKVVVADMQIFLRDFGRWIDQLELEFNTNGAAHSAEFKQNRITEISAQMAEAFTALHERFEDISNGIEPDARPAHEDFVKRQLHPLMMCSPFAHRTYSKPLGYAGDYEMVNMILREPLEGGSLYAKAVNGWFLRQWPAEAHRNRISYLTERLCEEALRGARRKQPVRILNLGCGPAHEIIQFLTESDLCQHAEFFLWDFNDETVERTGRSLEECRKKFNRRTSIHVTKKSVHQVLKDGVRAAPGAKLPQYDYIYCAGLFDYLTDKTCKQIMAIFYEWLAPDGLLAITNVVDCKPFRNMLEFLLDWHLIYRDTAQGRGLIPRAANPDYCRILRDSTEVNLMVEVRKPSHG